MIIDKLKKLFDRGKKIQNVSEIRGTFMALFIKCGGNLYFTRSEIFKGMLTPLLMQMSNNWQVEDIDSEILSVETMLAEQFSILTEDVIMNLKIQSLYPFQQAAFSSAIILINDDIKDYIVNNGVFQFIEVPESKVILEGDSNFLYSLYLNNLKSI